MDKDSRLPVTYESMQDEFKNRGVQGVASANAGNIAAVASEAFDPGILSDTETWDTISLSQDQKPSGKRERIRALQGAGLGDLSVHEVETSLQDAVFDPDEVADIEQEVASQEGAAPATSDERHELHSQRAPEALSEIEERGDEIDLVNITDYGDSDGAGCAALYQHKHGDAAVDIPLNEYKDSDWTRDGPDLLRDVAEAAPDDTEIAVTDINFSDQPDEWYDAISDVSDDNHIRVRDHHSDDMPRRDDADVGDTATVQDFEELDNVDYALADEGDKAAVTVVMEEDMNGGEDVSEDLEELAELTRIRDTWQADDPRKDEADRLATAKEATTWEAYVDAAADGGAEGLMSEHGDKVEFGEWLSDEKQRIVMENSARKVEIEGTSVAFTYGDCDVSELSQKLRDEGCDVCVHQYHGTRISLRSADSTPVAADIANNLDGGGHACAAGGRFEEVGADDLGEDEYEYDADEGTLRIGTEWDTKRAQKGRPAMEILAKTAVGDALESHQEG